MGVRLIYTLNTMDARSVYTLDDQRKGAVQVRFSGGKVGLHLRFDGERSVYTLDSMDVSLVYIVSISSRPIVDVGLKS